MSTVSGRVYTSTRVRGFAEWNQRSTTRQVVEQIHAVLAEYQDYLPMTARQIFYRLVGAYGYEKAESAYERVLNYLNRGRRAGVFDWGHIRDDGATEVRPAGWADIPEFMNAVIHTANTYRRDLTQGQPVIVELWVEAAGMVPQITRVAAPYGVTVYSSGGFDSTTLKHDAADRITDRDRPTHVLHIGDHDNSGCSILDSAAEDIAAFCDGMCGDPHIVRFTRVAVTPHLIEKYDLPTSPGKTTDARGGYMRETVQAEALDPATLAAEVRAAIQAALDIDILKATRALGAEEQRRLVRRLAALHLADKPRRSDKAQVELDFGLEDRTR